MEEPDPDPLRCFLVTPPTTPNPSRSAPSLPSRSSYPPDPCSASLALPADGSFRPSGAMEKEGASSVAGSQVGAELEISERRSQARESIHRQPSAAGQSPVPAAPEAVGGQDRVEIEASRTDPTGGSALRQPAAIQLPAPTEVELECQLPSSEAEQEPLPKPASPTTIDPVLQEKIWAILPDLASDLQNLKVQREGSAKSNSGLHTNPPILDSQEIGQDSTSAHSMAIQEEIQPVDEAFILSSRIPTEQKGKQIQREGINGAMKATGALSPTSITMPQSYAEEDRAVVSSSHQQTHHSSSPSSEEGWEPAKKHRKHRDAGKQHSAFKPPDLPIPKSTGFLFFKSKLEGRCYNCFSPNHIARDCNSSHRCWKCFRLGHRAIDCRAERQHQQYKDRESRTDHHNQLPSTKPASSPPRPRSYAEAVRGPATMVTARYPGDPRARPDRGYCAITATGPIKRRRDDLINRAAVCWLRSNSHDTEPHHLGEALRGRLRLRHDDMQILKHYPEQFLVIFRDPADRERLLARGSIYEGGRDFNFAPWSESRNATNVSWEFRVKVRIEGIPPHCWVEEVAAKALGRSCAVHYMEERTRRRERTRTFDLWAWCCNPCDIPKEVFLTVTEPDRELPPISVPFNQAPQHRDAPSDLKRGHLFTLRNHLEWGEDLTFLQGRGRYGGPMNRKPTRELVWTYGVPDSVGERMPDRRYEDHGREVERHHRRDDDDFDSERRNHGHRRRRSISSWVRNSRCRGALEDCVSTGRWRGGRGSPPARSRAGSAPRQVWRAKEVKKKSFKRVTFADPIATELKPPKTKIRDDSIFLIKEATVQENSINTTSNVSMDAEGQGKDNEKEASYIANTILGDTQNESQERTSIDSQDDLNISAAKGNEEGSATLDMNTFIKPEMMEEMQHAMAETIKKMNEELASSRKEMHFQRPVELKKMTAIQTMIEQGIKKKKEAPRCRNMAAQVVSEA